MSNRYSASSTFAPSTRVRILLLRESNSVISWHWSGLIKKTASVMDNNITYRKKKKCKTEYRQSLEEVQNTQERTYCRNRLFFTAPKSSRVWFSFWHTSISIFGTKTESSTIHRRTTFVRQRKWVCNKFELRFHQHRKRPRLGVFCGNPFGWQTETIKVQA